MLGLLCADLYTVSCKPYPIGMMCNNNNNNIIVEMDEMR